MKPRTAFASLALIGVALVCPDGAFAAPRRAPKRSNPRAVPAKSAPIVDPAASAALASTLESDDATPRSKTSAGAPGAAPLRPRGEAVEAVEAVERGPLVARGIDQDRDVVRPPPVDAPARALEIDASGGMAVMSQSFRSIGEARAGQLTDYDYAAPGFAARAMARYTGRVGSVFRLGAVGSYQYTGASAVDAPGARLSLESHTAVVAVATGVHANVLGGIDVDAQVGPAMVVNYIGIDARAALPSDRTIGLASGVRVAAPTLGHVGARALGLSIEGAYLGLLTMHDQTAGLEDGGSPSSEALIGSAELTIALFPDDATTQLSMVLGYRGARQTMRYSGPSVRNDPSNGNTSSAERVGEVHVSTLGLRLAR